MLRPSNKFDTILRREKEIVNASKKQNRQLPISQTERFSLKNADATPLSVPVMISHIIQKCVGRPTSKLMLSRQISSGPKD